MTFQGTFWYNFSQYLLTFIQVIQRASYVFACVCARENACGMGCVCVCVLRFPKE
jgi:hypothetical protein